MLIPPSTIQWRVIFGFPVHNAQIIFVFIVGISNYFASKGNANEEQSNLVQLIKLCDEVKENHESSVNLPLPENELER